MSAFEQTQAVIGPTAGQLWGVAVHIVLIAYLKSGEHMHICRIIAE